MGEVLVLLLACLAQVRAAFADGCPTPSFAVARAFGAAAFPGDMAVGDFNGDGKPDLAIADRGNLNSGSVLILLGDGDGAFQPAIEYKAKGSPRSVAIGDINGDGKLDLFVANEGANQVATFGPGPYVPNSVSVLLGKGDGTFQPVAEYGLGGNPQSVAVGDFNRDGKPDVAVAYLGLIGWNGSRTNGGVEVLLGKADGTLQAAVNYAAGMYPSSVVVGDFNSDGKSDLAVADSPLAPVLLGNGDGTFRAAINNLAEPGFITVAVGDFNGDGKPDLAVSSASGSVSVLLGMGDGTFEAKVKYALGQYPTSVAVGDFNGDGKPDLAVARSDAGVSVLLGVGDGTFQTPVNYSIGSRPWYVVVGDFNRDGKPDLVVANEGSDNVSVLLGNGDGTFPGANVSELSGGLAVADFNGDGKRDLVVASYDRVSVLLGTGGGAFKAGIESAGGGISATVGDFNRDGTPDLAMARWEPAGNSTNGSVSVRLGKGDGTFQAAVKYGVGLSPSSVAVGDFNRDGKPDLVAANSNIIPFSPFRSPPAPSTVSVLLGKGDGTFQTAAKYGAGEDGSFPSSVAVGDFNGDGKPDLAVTTTLGGSGIVLVLLGNGDGTFQGAVNYGVPYGYSSVTVEDFNSDGKLDLAVANIEGVSVLLGKGDGTFQTFVKYSTGSNSTAMAVGDFNGDRKPDLAVGGSVLLGKGDGRFQPPVSFVGYVITVAVGDFNSDNRPDLAAASNGGTSVLLNTCGSLTGASLAALRSGGNVTVSWPFPSTGFVLESTTSLSPPNWQPAREAPMTNAARLEIIAPVSQNSRFFRLHKP